MYSLFLIDFFMILKKKDNTYENNQMKTKLFSLITNISYPLILDCYTPSVFIHNFACSL